MPEESHERRHYQSFRPFSPFSEAEALEDGEEVRMFKVIFLKVRRRVERGSFTLTLSQNRA